MSKLEWVKYGGDNSSEYTCVFDGFRLYALDARTEWHGSLAISGATVETTIADTQEELGEELLKRCDRHLLREILKIDKQLESMRGNYEKYLAFMAAREVPK